MNRRQLLFSLSAAAFGSAATGTGALAQAARPEAGIQFASFLPGTAPWEQYSAGLGRIRDMGYDTVQIAGLGGKDPAQIRRRVDELGLTLRSMHIGNDQVNAYMPPPLPAGQTAPAGTTPPFQLAATAAYTPLGIVQIARAMLPRARDLGVQWAMIGHSGWRNLSTVENIRAWCDAMNEANKIAQGVGLGLSYHSHDLDFRPVGGQVPFDLMVAGTDPTIKYELDIGWCVQGGGDPVAVINKHYARLCSLHLRDVRDGQLVAAGTGNRIQWPALMEASRRIQNVTYYAEHPGGQQAEANATTALRFMREQGIGRRAA